MSSTLFIFTLFIVLFSIFIFIGITGGPKNTEKDNRIKNTVIQLNATQCSGGEIVSCEDENIGAFAFDTSGEGGDDYCNSVCKEAVDATGLSDGGKKMKCAVSKKSKEEGLPDPVTTKICVETNEKNTDICSFENGGQLMWSGSSNSGNEMGWSCMCNWPQYAATENCKKINRNICGLLNDEGKICKEDTDCYSNECTMVDKDEPNFPSKCSKPDSSSGKFIWSATTNIPENVICQCDEGFTRLASYEGFPDICVNKNDTQFYLDTYYNPGIGTKQ